MYDYLVGTKTKKGFKGHNKRVASRGKPGRKIMENKSYGTLYSVCKCTARATLRLTGLNKTLLFLIEYILEHTYPYIEME